MLASLLPHRYLIFQMIQREVLQRYRGSFMGFLWTFLHPVLMLLVYMFVFGIVMRMKWGVEGRDDVEFGVVMFAGLLIHGLLAEVLVRSASLITSNPQYVKKVVFPLPILSVISVGSALFHLLTGLVILFAIALVTGTALHWTVLYTPLVILPFLVLMLGVSWLLSALCVFVRDLAQVMGVLVTMFLFLAPILYPLTAVPAKLQTLMLWLNPLTVIVEQLRAVALFGQAPNWLHLGIYTAVASLVMLIGYWFFMRTHEAFADVI